MLRSKNNTFLSLLDLTGICDALILHHFNLGWRPQTLFHLATVRMSTLPPSQRVSLSMMKMKWPKYWDVVELISNYHKSNENVSNISFICVDSAHLWSLTPCSHVDHVSDGVLVSTDTPRCRDCSQHHLQSTPALSDRKRRGMKKYQALIKLNNSSNNTSTFSDVSTLNLTNLDESRPELDTTYDSQKVPVAYYTIDSRRLASKHQKSQDERKKLLYGIKHFNLNVQKGLKILQENEFVDETPESVAKFLFRQERLSKKQIG